MWRAFFLAVGIFAFTVGVECMLVENVVVVTNQQQGPSFLGRSDTPTLKPYTPPEWAPWSLMAAGSIVVIYSFTLPRRVKE